MTAHHTLLSSQSVMKFMKAGTISLSNLAKNHGTSTTGSSARAPAPAWLERLTSAVLRSSTAT